MSIKRFLDVPTLYHFGRHLMTGGLPFRQWVPLYGLDDPTERVADIGAGPADILRHVRPDRLPAFYLAVDLDERYTAAARRRAASKGLKAEFVILDLRRLPTDEAIRRQLLDALDRHAITRVLLLGLIHHIDDTSAESTLRLLRDAPSVRTIVTQDPVRLPHGGLNNFLADHDRGAHIRFEADSDALFARAGWTNVTKTFTHPGFKPITYIHYTARR